MPYARDPLSERYDTQAGRLLGRALGRRRDWVYDTVSRPRPGPKTLEWLRAHGISLSSVDDGGLTEYERAFQRAVFWNAKRLGIHRPADAWKVEREWGPVTARGRLFGMRIVLGSELRRKLPERRASERWDKSAEARSGGVGSPFRRYA
jgi:hypothetical protein